MAIKKNSGPNKAPLRQDQLHVSAAEMIARHVVQLSEHFETVQIVCTDNTPNGETIWFANGKGNDFARAKSLEMWLRDFYQIHG